MAHLRLNVFVEFSTYVRAKDTAGDNVARPVLSRLQGLNICEKTARMIRIRMWTVDHVQLPTNTFDPDGEVDVPSEKKHGI